MLVFPFYPVKFYRVQDRLDHLTFHPTVQRVNIKTEAHATSSNVSCVARSQRDERDGSVVYEPIERPHRQSEIGSRRFSIEIPVFYAEFYGIHRSISMPRSRLFSGCRSLDFPESISSHLWRRVLGLGIVRANRSSSKA